MELLYTDKKLFEESDCYYAHFISADFCINSGASKIIDTKCHISSWFRTHYGENWHRDVYHYYLNDGVCLIDRYYKLFHIIATERYWSRPTKDSIRNALREMAVFCKRDNIDEVRIAKPEFKGKVKLEDIELIIREVFADFDIKIYIVR